MANMTLTRTPVLGNYAETFGDITIVERDDLAFVSIATPLGGDDALKKAFKSAYKMEMPAPSVSSVARDKRAVATAADQMMLIFPSNAPLSEPAVQKAIKGAGYTTEQTGAWVALEISGPSVRSVLERLCPLDLAPSVFPINASARTVMEHMGSMVIRTDDNSFLLLSASSSAQSFLHAVETSIAYTR